MLSKPDLMPAYLTFRSHNIRIKNSDAKQRPASPGLRALKVAAIAQIAKRQPRGVTAVRLVRHLQDCHAAEAVAQPFAHRERRLAVVSPY